jgi:hypothetical protein
MALKKMLPHPHPKYTEDDHTLLANGQLRFYESGTSTPKVVYSSASGTSYGATVELDSTGRPESGPIYYDTDGLYKVEIYSRVDDTPTYTLLDTIDPVGETFSAVATDLNENIISNWSFEVAGDTPPAAENWTDTDSGSVVTRDTSDHNHGAASLKFTSSSSGADYSDSAVFEVSPNMAVGGSFLLKATNAGAQPAIKIYWLTNAQAAVSDEYLYRGDSGVTPTSWELIDGLYAEPPATARYAHIRVIGNESGTSYTTNFDGISLRHRNLASIFPAAGVTPFGLNPSIAADTAHDINLTGGTVLDSTLTEPMLLPTEMTKQIDAGWAVGDDQGGLFAGSAVAANGRLGMYLIKDTDTGQVDWGFDDDAGLSPTLPTGYDVYRYLGSLTLDASGNIEDAVWYGSEFIKLASPDEDVDESTLTTYAPGSPTMTSGTMNAPPESILRYLARIELGSAATELFLFIRATDAAWAAAKFGQGFELGTDTIDELWTENTVRVDSSSQLDYAVGLNSGPATATLKIFTVGWIDTKRDNP